MKNPSGPPRSTAWFSRIYPEAKIAMKSMTTCLSKNSQFFLIFEFYRLFDRFAKKYNFRCNPLINLKVSCSGEMLTLIEKVKKTNLEKQKKMIIYQNTPGVNLKSPHLNVTKTIKDDKQALKKLTNPKETEVLQKKIELLENIEKLIEKINDLKSKIHKVSTGEHKIKSVFITFQRIKHRNMFLKLLPKTSFHLLSKVSEEQRQKLIEEDKLIYAEVPPLPSNIKWKNYNYTTTQKTLRRVGIWGIYILVFCIRMALFLLMLISRGRSLLDQREQGVVDEEFPYL